MRYSFTTGAAGDLDPRTLADLAAEAEDHGWDAFFLEDYVVYQGQNETRTYDPWVCLAAMAMTTTTIKLGTTVTPLSRRRPWKVAAEAATLDHLSRGRVILGVGIGDSRSADFQATGEPTTPKVLAERLDEALEIIARLWTGEPVDFDGKHFHLEGLQTTATPLQDPRIPIWVGGDLEIPAVRRRLARWDGCCAYKKTGKTTPEDVREICRSAKAAHFDFKFSDIRDPDEIAELQKAGATWWGQFVPPDAARVRDTIRQGPPPLRR